jgi:RNA polymerase sigma factor (sigma-70 family)
MKTEKITIQEEIDLALRISTNDGIAKNILIEKSIPIIKSIALGYKYKNLGELTLDDLIQIGLLEVTKYINNFNPQKGRFSSWLHKIINQAIVNAIPDNKLIRIPHGSHFKALRKNNPISIILAPLSDANIEKPLWDNNFTIVENKHCVNKLLGILSMEEREAIIKYFGFSGSETTLMDVLHKKHRNTASCAMKRIIKKMREFALADNTNLASGVRE